jgi:hypothetical protein
MKEWPIARMRPFLPKDVRSHFISFYLISFHFILFNFIQRPKVKVKVKKRFCVGQGTMKTLELSLFGKRVVLNQTMLFLRELKNEGSLSVTINE